MEMLYNYTTEETLFQWGVVIGASLMVAIYDLRTGRIPNAVTIPLLIGGLIWGACHGGLSGLGNSIGACFVLALPFVLLFMFAGGGAGDAKLMGAIGAWVGLKPGITVLLCVVTAGLVFALTKALVKRRLKSVLSNIFVIIYTFMLSLIGSRKIPDMSERPDQQQSCDLTFPYGLAIFAGVFVAGGILIW